MASIPWVYFQDSSSITGFTLSPLGSVADGATVFTELNDAPSSYLGQGLKHVRVNFGGTALEFITPTLLQLSDAPDNYTSAANKHVLVNAAGTAIEFDYPIGIQDGSESVGRTVGQSISAERDIVDAAPLTTATAQTVSQIILSPGDWDVNGLVGFTNNASTSFTRVLGGIGLEDDTVPTGFVVAITSAAHTPGATSGLGFAAPVRRLNITSSTTVYLIAFANFTVSTASAYGYIQARRMR